MKFKLAGIALTSLALIGCGGGDGDDNSPKTATIYIEGLEKPDAPEVTQNAYCLDYGMICMKYNGYWVPFEAEQKIYTRDVNDDYWDTNYDDFDVYTEQSIDVTSSVGDILVATSETVNSDSTDYVELNKKAKLWWDTEVQYGEETIMMEDVIHSPSTSIFTLAVSESTLSLLGTIAPTSANLEYHDAETGYVISSTSITLGDSTPVFADDGLRYTSFNVDAPNDDSVTLGDLEIDFTTDAFGELVLSITPQDFINNGMVWEKGHHYWLTLDVTNTSRGETDISYTIHKAEIQADAEK